MSLPSYLEKFINKAIVSIVFPDDASLNVTAFDMGEDMASMSIDEETIKRLPVAFGTVGSAEMAVPATITFSVLKGSQAGENWLKGTIKNGLIPGVNKEVLFTDDAGNQFKLFACTRSIGEISANGQSAVYNFTIQGSLAVNEELYGTTIG